MLRENKKEMKKKANRELFLKSQEKEYGGNHQLEKLKITKNTCIKSEKKLQKNIF